MRLSGYFQLMGSTQWMSWPLVDFIGGIEALPAGWEFIPAEELPNGQLVDTGPWCFHRGKVCYGHTLCETCEQCPCQCQKAEGATSGLGG